MWKPYQEILNHEADFRVKYRFYSQEEGAGRRLYFKVYALISFMMLMIARKVFFLLHFQSLKTNMEILY